MIIRDDSPRKSGPRPPRATAPEPVEGEEIPLSRGSALWSVVGLGAGVAIGVTLVVVWCVTVCQWLFDDGGFPNLAPLILGLILIAVPGSLAAVLLRKVRAGRRIVIGADCVQVVEGRGEDTRVVASIPFANVESLKLTRVDFGHRIDFELIDTHDPRTYLPGIDIESNYRAHEYHYAITERYRDTMEEILYLIRRARKKWRERETEATHTESIEE